MKRNECVSYEGIRGKRLRKRHIAEMFPEGENKRWQVLSRDHAKALMMPGEVRVLFDEGALSCTATPVRGEDNRVPKKTRRSAQLFEELTPDFFEKVRYYAEEKKYALQKAVLTQGESVYVQYVNGSGIRCSVCWDGHQVRDAKGCYLLEFLQNCVLPGCHLGYVDEQCEKHNAFTNDNLRELLRVGLAFDIAKQQVSFVEGERHLNAQDLQSMPYMDWTVVPQLRQCTKWYSCVISFAGAILEGRPRLTQMPLQTYLLPRNYLWALCFEKIRPANPRCFDWYKRQVGGDLSELKWHFEA